MCMVCDGYSWEEIARHLDLNIQVNGYFIQSVKDDGGDPEVWSYTIGVNESWSHPDFVILDMELDAQVLIIDAVVEEVREHGDVGTHLCQLLDIEIVVVHPSHFADGLVAQWEVRNQRDAAGGDFLQIVPGSKWFCECHTEMVRRLDAPLAEVVELQTPTWCSECREGAA